MNLHRSLSFATTSWCVHVCTRLPASMCDDVVLFRDDAIDIGAFYVFYIQENSQSVPLVAATLQVSQSAALLSLLVPSAGHFLLYLLPTPIPSHSHSLAHLSLLLVHPTLPPPHFPPPPIPYTSLCICVLVWYVRGMHMFEVMFLRVSLQTLLRFLNWIPLGYIFETKVISTLIYKVC